jgi:hypothetical protein
MMRKSEDIPFWLKRPGGVADDPFRRIGRLLG